MDRFVCVRIVQGYGIDLSLFQYDYWSTWSAFFMNGDRTIYGRFSAGRLNDLERLKKSVKAALEVHAGYPGNKADLAGKKGLPLPWARPEELPSNRNRRLQRVRGRGSCIHCHHILEGIRKSFRSTGRKMPSRIEAPYPTTGRIGLSFDMRERSTITQVLKNTPAARAGLKPGDQVVRMNGQSILSIADVEWAIYSAPDEGKLRVEVLRDGNRVKAELSLRGEWRKD